LSAEHHEALPSLPFNLHSEARHHRQGDLDIGFGDQLPHHLHTHGTPQQGKRHQQAGQELAGHIAAHLRHITGQHGRFDLQGRKTFGTQIFDVRTELSQGIHQITDGTFVHARHARQLITSTRQRQCGSQGTEGRTCIAKEKLCFLIRKVSATTCHAIGVIT
jgi:hypothetical protein